MWPRAPLLCIGRHGGLALWYFGGMHAGMHILIECVTRHEVRLKAFTEIAKTSPTLQLCSSWLATMLIFRVLAACIQPLDCVRWASCHSVDYMA
jgi:hypothetical protein